MSAMIIVVVQSMRLMKLKSSGMYCRVLSWMSTDVSEGACCDLIALVMEAARISETTVDIQLKTRQYISEDSELHTPRPENVKSHMGLMFISAVT
jgi:hypothetical protein